MKTEKCFKEVQNLRDEAQEKINNLTDESKKILLQQKLDRISDDINEAVTNNNEYELEKLRKELTEFIFIEVGNPNDLLKKVCHFPRRD